MTLQEMNDLTIFIDETQREFDRQKEMERHKKKLIPIKRIFISGIILCVCGALMYLFPKYADTPFVFTLGTFFVLSLAWSTPNHEH